MEILSTSFNVVYPMMLLMAIGMILRKLRIVSDAGIKEMNALIYKLFFPFMIYANIMKSDLKTDVNPRLLIFVFLTITAVFVVCFLLVKRFISDNPTRGTMVQGMFRSNFIVFGLSIVTALYGEERLGVAAILATVAVPYMNALSVVVLEIFRGRKPNPVKIAVGILKNPIIDFSILALVFKLLNFNPLASTVDSVSKVSTTFALIVIGASIKFKDFSKYKKLLVCGVTAKLIVVPAFAILAAVIAGFRDEALISIVCIFGGPCATASSAMAQQMEADGELAALLVMSTSMLCIISFFFWIYLLKVINLA